MNERQHLMKKIATCDFAVDELLLYLNTHPNDRVIIRKLNELQEKAETLRNEYEQKFGPIKASSMDVNPYAWINSPWPWDGGDK